MTCFECGQKAEHEHHVIPKVKGGTKTIPLCTTCHSKVHGSKNLLSISHLTRVKLDEKRRKKERTGAVPYGYDLHSNKKTLIVNENEQKVIKMMEEWREKGWSYHKIGQNLTIHEIITKTGNKKWSHQSINRILTRMR